MQGSVSANEIVKYYRILLNIYNILQYYLQFKGLERTRWEPDQRGEKKPAWEKPIPGMKILKIIA
jgi:hypothetical protein